MNSHPEQPPLEDEHVLDVDALVEEITEQVKGMGGEALTPFVDDVSHAMGAGRFSISPTIHPSTKPLVGPVVTRGKRMASRAAMPMVADLGAQVATALDAMQAALDDLAAEVDRLQSRIDDLEGPPRAPGTR